MVQRARVQYGAAAAPNVEAKTADEVQSIVDEVLAIIRR